MKACLQIRGHARGVSVDEELRTGLGAIIARASCTVYINLLINVLHTLDYRIK